MTQDVLGIVGSSHSAHALAAYLSKQGHRVILFARDMSKLGSLQYHRRLRAEGHIEGEFELYKVTDQWKILCTEASVIFLATVTTAY